MNKRKKYNWLSSSNEPEEIHHIEDEYSWAYEDDEEDINIYDAAEIWLSNGKDEDYMFGYTEEELEDAL